MHVPVESSLKYPLRQSGNLVISVEYGHCYLSICAVSDADNPDIDYTRPRQLCSVTKPSISSILTCDLLFSGRISTKRKGRELQPHNKC
jgi:hypothetical protein